MLFIVTQALGHRADLSHGLVPDASPLLSLVENLTHAAPAAFLSAGEARVASILHFTAPWWMKDILFLAAVGTVLTVVILFGCGMLTLHVANHYFCRAVQKAITSFDRHFLGTDIELESVFLNVFTGQMTIKDLKVTNPQGCRNPYALTAGSFIMDIHLTKLITSLGSHLIVEKLICHDVHVTVEQRKSDGRKNIDVLLDHMVARQAEESKSRRSKNKGEDGKKGKKRKKTRVKVELEQVSIVNVNAHWRGLQLVVADIQYDNFAQQHGATAFDDVCFVVLRSILLSVRASFAGAVQRAVRNCAGGLIPKSKLKHPIADDANSATSRSVTPTGRGSGRQSEPVVQPLLVGDEPTVEEIARVTRQSAPVVPPTMDNLRPDPESMCPRPGSVVVVSGLTQNKQLNGTQGVVIGPAEEYEGRAVVQIEGFGAICPRYSCLQVVSAGDD
mmetsp:Transcript_33718/g.73704  ORF Transcript_33718/g.73704 Transcript_33718/m.73704 type:complete len:445 (-) Transcript_33718:79-1413(-)